jgi:hypothetical protein
MSTVFTGTHFHGLKRTLNVIATDKSDIEGKLAYKKYMKVSEMEDHYEDDLEVAGPALLSERYEGTEISSHTIREGNLFRYIARSFGGKITITREAIKDGKYKQIIDAATKLKFSGWQTLGYDMANLLARGFNTAYTFGSEALPLFSASHTIPGGGTFSNLLAVPMAPSVLAVSTMRAQARKLPGYNGVRHGHIMIEKIVAPVDQETLWETILQSNLTPEPGNSAELNMVKRMNLELVIEPYWDNTTTNWMAITDQENGLQMRWRDHFEATSWVGNENRTMTYALNARWSRGITNFRSVIGSEA